MHKDWKRVEKKIKFLIKNLNGSIDAKYMIWDNQNDILCKFKMRKKLLIICSKRWDYLILFTYLTMKSYDDICIYNIIQYSVFSIDSSNIQVLFYYWRWFGYINCFAWSMEISNVAIINIIFEIIFGHSEKGCYSYICRHR